MTITQNPSFDDVVLASDFVTKHPNIFPSMDSFRWQYNQRHKNGLAEAGAVVKRNGRLYIIKPRLMAWFLESAA